MMVIENPSARNNSDYSKSAKNKKGSRYRRNVTDMSYERESSMDSRQGKISVEDVEKYCKPQQLCAYNS